MLARCLVATCAVVTASAGPAARQGARLAPPPYEAAIDHAYRAAYNLDYDEALAQARRAVALAPEESAAHRGLAGILWLRIVFLRGAVSVDHYISGLTSGKLALPKPDAELDKQFKSALDRAIALAEARRRAQPGDVAAIYDAGRAYALQASYAASVEASTMAAFRAAKRAFDAEEEVLERDARHAGATFIVGTYRYIVSALSLPTRMLAYIVGFGGGKERGIQMIESVASHPMVTVDARTALMLIYTREGRHQDVMRLARELHADYPRNRLYVLEEGAAAIRAGRAAEAEATLTRGLDLFERDPRHKVIGERGFWLYKRAVARVILRRLPEAAADLVASLEADPAGWIRGRVHLELGKVHDLWGRRDAAVADYRMARSLAETNDDPACVGAANRYLGRAFGK
jgi:tetratricopeptide (TPR) repeat protein